MSIYLLKIYTYFRTKPLRMLFALLWIYFIYEIYMAGFRPNPYAAGRFSPEPHHYPTSFVSFLLTIMVVHIGLLTVTYSVMRSQWKWLVMLIVTFVILLPLAMISMHAPPPLTWIMMWLMLMMLLLLSLAISKVIILLSKKLL